MLSEQLSCLYDTIFPTCLRTAALKPSVNFDLLLKWTCDLRSSLRCETTCIIKSKAVHSEACYWLNCRCSRSSSHSAHTVFALQEFRDTYWRKVSVAINRRPEKHLWFVSVEWVGNLRPLQLRASEPRTQSDRLPFSSFSFFLGVCQGRWLPLEAREIYIFKTMSVHLDPKNKYINLKKEKKKIW